MNIASETIIKEIKQNENQLLNWFHDLHQIPELEMELPQTVAYVCEALKEMGVSYQVLPNSSGIIALIGTNGPVIGIRADMDALAVQEETNLPYASQNGYMHACGHDSHTAMLLAVAAFMKHHENELPGRVKLLFQTGEEVLRGAKHMIQYGALANPKPDYILALHAGSFCGDGFTSGDIIMAEDITFYSSDSFRISVCGKGGHAASPHLSIDSIVTAARIVDALQTLVSREVDPSIPSVISITHISAGAQTYNVLPDQALLMGGIRTADPHVRDYLKQRVVETAAEIAASVKAQATTEFVDGCPAVINDKHAAKQVFHAISKLFPDSVHWMKKANGCSEDASYFFEKVPGCYFFLASFQKEDGILYPHHNCRFRLDETVFWKGVAAMSGAVLDLMEELQ